MKLKKTFTLSLLLLLIASSLFAITHEELLQRVALNNPSLQNSRKDIDLAVLDLKDAQASYHPTVELTASGTYMVNPLLGKIVVNPEDYLSGQTGTSGALSNFSSLGLDGPMTIYKGMENTHYNFSLKITQPLYTWNKIGTAVDLFDKVVTMQQIQNTSLFKQLASELEARESAIYYIKMMKGNLEEQDLLAKQLIDIVNEAYLNDLVLEQDLLEAQIQAKRIQIGIKELEKEEKIQLSQITQLTNLDTIKSDDIEYIFHDKRVENLLQRDYLELEKKAISQSSNSIQLLSILQSVKADENRIARNDIYWKPDVALQIETGYSGPRFPFIEKGFYTQNQGTFNVTVALQSTLWDGGKKLNNIKRTKINEEKANWDIVDAKNQIIQTLNDNFYTIDLATSNIEYQELNSLIIDKKIDNLSRAFEEGYGSEDKVLRAMLEKKASQLELLQLKLERAASYFTIKYLINE